MSIRCSIMIKQGGGSLLQPIFAARLVAFEFQRLDFKGMRKNFYATDSLHFAQEGTFAKRSTRFPPSRIILFSFRLVLLPRLFHLSLSRIYSCKRSNVEQCAHLHTRAHFPSPPRSRPHHCALTRVISRVQSFIAETP